MVLQQEDLNTITQKKQENDLPYKFIKMTEILKEEMKNSLKEMDEETNKNWKKSLNLLKNPRKNNQRGEVNISNS